MKQILLLKFLLPIGLLVLAASFILKHFLPLSDLTDGFIKGMGIGIMVISFFKYPYSKKESQ